MPAKVYPLVALSAGAGLAVALFLAGVFVRLPPRRCQDADEGAPRGKCFSLGTLSRFGRRRDRRLAEERLEEVLEEIAAYLRSGDSLPEALRHSAEGGCGHPWPRLLGEVVRSYDQGVALADALSVLETLESHEVSLMVRGMRFHCHAGGDLAAALSRLADDVRERRLVQGEIEARTAEARWTAFVVAGVPVLLAAYFALHGRQMLAPLLDDPMGRAGAVYGLLSWCSGVFVLRRLLRFRF